MSGRTRKNQVEIDDQLEEELRDLRTVSLLKHATRVKRPDRIRTGRHHKPEKEMEMWKEKNRHSGNRI